MYVKVPWPAPNGDGFPRQRHTPATPRSPNGSNTSELGALSLWYEKVAVEPTALM